MNTHQQPSRSEAVAYSPTVNIIRPVLAKHLNEYPNAMLVELADLLTSHSEALRERVESLRPVVSNEAFRTTGEIRENDAYTKALDDILALLTDKV